MSQLLSIKTGGCAEDCGYCSQSARFDTGLKATRLLDVEAVLERAAQAKASGAQRFCMGAAWRSPKDRDMPALEAMIAGVKAMGLETCVTLGMLRADQARRLADAGLDFYNHNLDTAPEDYARVVSTPQLRRPAGDAGARARRGGGRVLRRASWAWASRAPPARG